MFGIVFCTFEIPSLNHITSANAFKILVHLNSSDDGDGGSYDGAGGGGGVRFQLFSFLFSLHLFMFLVSVWLSAQKIIIIIMKQINKQTILMSISYISLTNGY